MKGSLKMNEQSWAIEAKIKKEVGGGGVKWVTLFIKPWHYFRENFCSHPNLETRPLFIIKMPTFSSNPSKKVGDPFYPTLPHLAFIDLPFKIVPAADAGFRI